MSGFLGPILPAATTIVTPSWKGDVSDPAIGNGSISCRVAREGAFIWAGFQLSFGSTTTFGSGNFYLQLPAPYDAVATANASGTAYAFDAGTTNRTGLCLMLAGTNKIYFLTDQNGDYWHDTLPFTWSGANGDYMFGSIKFPVA
jgi:hypothetical protein